jgi:hypothetical protein
VADVGEVNSIGSPWGDSEVVSGDGKWLLRDFGLPEPPPKGLRGTDSNMVAMAQKGAQATLESDDVSRLKLDSPVVFSLRFGEAKPRSYINESYVYRGRGIFRCENGGKLDEGGKGVRKVDDALGQTDWRVRTARVTSSCFAIDKGRFKPVSSNDFEEPLWLSRKCDQGRQSHKGVTQIAGHQRRQVNSTRRRDATALSHHRKRVPLDRKGRLQQQQVWSIQDVALSVEVQLDSQQPH